MANALRLSRLIPCAAVACLSLGLATPAAAQTKPDCTAPTATPEIAYCTELELKAADAALNRAYQDAIAVIKAADHLKPKQRRDWEQVMREAQRHWIAFTDRDCGEVTGWEWHQGTGQGTATLACRLVKTRTRTDELKARYAR